MAKLHIFNPEHDLALASGLANFTSPHAGRQLRADLGYLPAIWAEAGDYVLVENVEDAKTGFSRAMHRQFDGFVEKRQLAKLEIEAVEPWGWDAALKAFILRYGVGEGLLPTDKEIDTIRDLSHRKHALTLLRDLQIPGTTGISWLQDFVPGISQFLEDHQHIVLKAPWSSSGRGIRFVDYKMNEYQMRWARNVIERQGCVVMEPYYNKVKDFGMEFESDGEGTAHYLGLSLFHTVNGAYTGNILASEDEKREAINHYVSGELLDDVKVKIQTLLGKLYRNKYKGPLGVDMMIVAREDKQGFLLHPCVEINLRRTMGHVALAIQREGIMQITYSDNHYKLKIHKR